MSQSASFNPAYMRVKAMAPHVGMGVSTLWKLAKYNPDFPKPIKAGSKVTLFNVAAVESFIERQASSLSKGA